MKALAALSQPGESQILHEDDFSVKVYPGVDYAFIVALIVVLNEEDMV